MTRICASAEAACRGATHTKNRHKTIPITKPLQEVLRGALAMLATPRKRSHASVGRCTVLQGALAMLATPLPCVQVFFQEVLPQRDWTTSRSTIPAVFLGSASVNSTHLGRL